MVSWTYALKSESKYEQVLHDAWLKILERHGKGEISLEGEADVQFHLFAACLNLMEQNERFEKPYDIYPEFGKRFEGKKPDLVLNTAGDTVVVEVKMTALTGMNRSTLRGVVNQLDKYIAQDAKSAYLLYLRKIAPDMGWVPSFLVGEDPRRLVRSYTIGNVRYEGIIVERRVS